MSTRSSIVGDDEPLSLSEHAMSALNEFLKEQQELHDDLIAQSANNSTKNHHKKPSLKLIQEDWQLSQFWYTDETQQTLADECLAVCDKNLAILCAPSVFVKLQQISADCIKESSENRVYISLFEFDQRFSHCVTDEFSEFVFYDYKRPCSISADHHQGCYDTFLIDPPFLSSECFEKVAQTIKFLQSTPNPKIIVCSGAVMEEKVWELWSGKECRFQPEHEKGLSNHFKCYVNYTSITTGFNWI